MSLKKRQRRQTGKLPRAVLADIVRRIVEVARPQRIVTVWSAARGESGPDSDV